jgi:outer membrane protein OmpA-like peptidoglycan-associated protein
MLVLLLVLPGYGCKATVPESVYQADLQSQQTGYERRLRRLQEAQQAAASERERINTVHQAKQGRLSMRIEQLELLSAHKQGLLEALALQETPVKPPRALRKVVKPLMTLKLGPLKEQGADVRLRASADVFFEQASTQLKPSSKPHLAKIAEVLAKQALVRLRVELGTDALGTPKEDWQLTGTQGLALVLELAAMGADPSRLSHVALGRYAPVDTNDTEEGRTQNRRIDFVFSTLASDPFQTEKSVEGE